MESSKPFGLQMKCYRYVKAFRCQMLNKPDVDETRYDHLKFTPIENGIKISSSLDSTDTLVLTDEKGKTI